MSCDSRADKYHLKTEEDFERRKFLREVHMNEKWEVTLTVSVEAGKSTRSDIEHDILEMVNSSTHKVLKVRAELKHG